MNLTEGKQYRYEEMGCEYLVTLLRQNIKRNPLGDLKEFSLKVDEVKQLSPYFTPESHVKAGEHYTVSYTEGYEHYIDWRLRDILPQTSWRS